MQGKTNCHTDSWKLMLHFLTFKFNFTTNISTVNCILGIAEGIATTYTLSTTTFHNGWDKRLSKYSWCIREPWQDHPKDDSWMISVSMFTNDPYKYICRAKCCWLKLDYTKCKKVPIYFFRTENGGWERSVFHQNFHHPAWMKWKRILSIHEENHYYYI